MSLEIVFWDVQHGNASYIKTPNEKHIVCDLGTGSYESSNEQFSPLLHLRDEWNIQQIDCVIITHPHKDHINDIMNFDKFTPRVLVRPSHLSRDDIMKDVKEEDKPLFEKYLEISSKYSSPVTLENDIERPESMGSVKIEVFSPKSCSTSNINNHSIVTVLSYAQSKVVLTGDNEPPSWKELLENPDFVSAIKNANILLAPHHGRDSGFCKELFDHFFPDLTIISDGSFCDTSATNRYDNVTKGWKVHYRNGGEEERRCVTTRNDGYVVIKLGFDSDMKPYIDVNAKG